MAVDAARRGQGRGHQPSSISWPIDSNRSEIDGRLKQDLAYSPTGTFKGVVSILESDSFGVASGRSDHSRLIAGPENLLHTTSYVLAFPRASRGHTHRGEC